MGNSKNTPPQPKVEIKNKIKQKFINLKGGEGERESNHIFLSN